MSDREAQVTIEPSKRPGEIPQQDAPNGSPFAKRILSISNLGSILVALVVPYLAYRELLGLDWGEAWASLWRANAGLFALAFVLFYGRKGSQVTNKERSGIHG